MLVDSSHNQSQTTLQDNNAAKQCIQSSHTLSTSISERVMQVSCFVYELLGWITFEAPQVLLLLGYRAWRINLGDYRQQEVWILCSDR